MRDIYFVASPSLVLPHLKECRVVSKNMNSLASPRDELAFPLMGRRNSVTTAAKLPLGKNIAFKTKLYLSYIAVLIRILWFHPLYSVVP
ncbi:hypothetical protein WA026_003992 [Henosepilachna vigintioctopunctata]|uniref:Uncharacterized protein n=1 Tax=Henosepilachna vigintioctopunctata TaxID=420089 RepID=A0AAW1UF86_9CUCU